MGDGHAGLKRWRTRIGLVALVVAALLMRVCSEPTSDAVSPPAASWAFRSATVYPVIGEIGGEPVSIPPPYARIVEYEGDPAIGQTAVGKAPSRTYASKVRTLVFDLRYPDLTGLDGDAVDDEGTETTVWTTTWMRVLLNAGSRYFGEGFLERNVESLADPEGRTYAYRRMPDQEFGLAVYAPVGVDETRRLLANFGDADASDLNIYVHPGENGRVSTYIECSNVHHQAARCAQEFDLRPEMEAAVSISYRKDLLPHWEEIQDAVRRLVLGFRIALPSD